MEKFCRWWKSGLGTAVTITKINTRRAIRNIFARRILMPRRRSGFKTPRSEPSTRSGGGGYVRGGRAGLCGCGRDGAGGRFAGGAGSEHAAGHDGDEPAAQGGGGGGIELRRIVSTHD